MADRLIMAITGHKSLPVLQCYDKVSEDELMGATKVSGTKPVQEVMEYPAGVAQVVDFVARWEGVSTKFEAPAISWRSRRDQAAEPEVMFRIVHKLHGDNGDGNDYHDQAVEVALGPRDAFKNGNVGNVVRRVPKNLVVCAVPPNQANPRPPKAPRVPRVKELLLQAQEWQKLLASGEVRNQADIAQREGITRARVTQIMHLLNLAPEIQDNILNMPNSSHRPAITDRALRPITQINDHKEQLEAFQGLV